MEKGCVYVFALCASTFWPTLMKFGTEIGHSKLSVFCFKVTKTTFWCIGFHPEKIWTCHPHPQGQGDLKLGVLGSTQPKICVSGKTLVNKSCVTPLIQWGGSGQISSGPHPGVWRLVQVQGEGLLPWSLGPIGLKLGRHVTHMRTWSQRCFRPCTRIAGVSQALKHDYRVPRKPQNCISEQNP